MKTICTLALLLSALMLHAEIILNRDYRIVLPPDGVPAERTAAAELKKYLRELNGLDLAIGTEKGVKNIYIGQHKHLKINYDELKPDEIILRTLDNGDVVLSGDRPRGSLYAVFTLLEDYLNINFWTSFETEVPQVDQIKIPDLNVRYASPFPFREALQDDYKLHPEFAVKRRFNGHHVKVGEEWGGRFECIGFVHTFELFCPAAKYLKSNPEYFSFVNGKRVGGQSQGQLCLTNPELIDLVTANMLETLGKSTNPQLISLSQNDNNNYCRCDNCRASDARYGGPSGTLINFVNTVAGRLAKVHPGIAVETLAYMYSVNPPANIRPAANVVIRLCSHDMDLSKPLDSANNRSFVEDLKGWEKLTDRVMIWDYINNFGNFMIPFPNLRVIDRNIKFFADKNIWNILEQGEYQTRGRCGDMGALRGWLCSKLLWDPSRDSVELTTYFLRNYYGAAAPLVQQYLDVLEDAFAAWPDQVKMRQPKAHQYLDYDVVLKANRIMEQAMVRTAGDPKINYRIRTLKMSTDFALLDYTPYLADVDLQKVETSVEDLINSARERNVRNFAESKSFDEYEMQLRGLTAALRAERPERFKSIAAQKYFDAQNVFFGVAASGVNTVDDPVASDGSAFCFANNRLSWSMQLFIPEVLKKRAKRWRLYAAVRCDNNVAGYGIQVGLYDIVNKKDVHKKVPASEIAGKEYKLIEIGTVELSKNCFLYAAPVANPAAGNGWLDRVIMIAE